MSTNYWTRWDPTNKKWEVSIDQGGTWADLIERPTIETLIANEIAAPAVSGAGKGKIYFDSTAKRFEFSENGTAYTPYTKLSGDTMSGLLTWGTSNPVPAIRVRHIDGKESVSNVGDTLYLNYSVAAKGIVIGDLGTDHPLEVCGDITTRRDLYIGNDAQLYLTKYDAQYVGFHVDSNDAFRYDRTNNIFQFQIGGSDEFIVANNYVHVQSASFVPGTDDVSAYIATGGYGGGISLRDGSSGSGSIWMQSATTIYFGSGNVGGARTVTATLDGSGNLYLVANCSALSFTDRTDIPKDKDESYAIIDSMQRKDGKLDKDLLHSSIKKIGTHERTDGTTETWIGRDLTMTISALTEVVKDLITRIEKLEKP